MDKAVWKSCLDCKFFTGEILREEKMLTSHGHTSKRKKYLYGCSKNKSVPHFVISKSDLKICHDHFCGYEKR